MNSISDLSARAIAFITAAQTTLLNGEIEIEKNSAKASILTIPIDEFEEKFRALLDNTDTQGKSDLKQNFSRRVRELVWISNNEFDSNVAINYTIKITCRLIGWLEINRVNGITHLLKTYGRYPTPYNWKLVLDRILYENPVQRSQLASVLQYLPIQIILALGGTGYDVHQQRLLQMWEADEDDKKALLSPEEISFSERFYKRQSASEIPISKLLEELPLLHDQLIKHGAPLSFGFIFNRELLEIQSNRERRENEEVVTGQRSQNEISPGIEVANKDPFAKGKEMGLCALALSGGGIRSATFNLGILQGLAEKKLIGRFDYLSTVSGGGYIGSWFASWIKRDQSVIKVSNRLNPKKSPDPSGEELNPIKWLRMYSNYLAPNSSIMSVDSWTFGITWLRNTLLNQVVIFLFFLAVLFCGSLLYQFWSRHLVHPLYTTWQGVLSWTTLLLLPAAILAGAGMYAYNKERFRRLNIRTKYSKSIGNRIIMIAMIGAYFISAWLSSEFFRNGVSSISVYERLTIFLPTALVAFLCLLLVAIMGNYADGIKLYRHTTVFAYSILVLYTVVATALGLTCLAVVSVLLGNIPYLNIGTYFIDKKVIQFILSVPLTLEIISVTVIVRMALLGKYFPDERREWWGRVGASIHRLSFLWILISASTLMGAEYLKVAFSKWDTEIIAATGGWMALVGSSVKAAFSEKTAGKGDQKGFYPAFLNILGKAGPYLFVLGLIILLPTLIHPLLNLVGKIFKDIGVHVTDIEILHLVIIIVCALTAYLLAMQLGVNEFSMYNFYRNRLVRGYLGGTRRTTDRQQTANPFTGFDTLDDEMMCNLTNNNGYYGPYPVINVALNASQRQGLDRHDRKAESFIFSPLYCGFDFSMARSSYGNLKSYDYAYRQTQDYAFSKGPTLGTAMAISGAAVNPNQGYHSSPATAFLLTIFNVQLGRWLGNPRKSYWHRSNPTAGLGYILNNLVNKTSTRDRFVALSDGGHFDNMGLYEMVRRKCPYIILCDAEQDNDFTCEGLANAIRKCRIDFGAEIKIDISKITNRHDDRYSESHFALGEITYVGENHSGVLLYIKSSVDGKEPVDIQEYAMKNKTFPHQSTADQFFDEEQFESYRKLGLHIAQEVFSDKEVIEKFKLSSSPGNGSPGYDDD